MNRPNPVTNIPHLSGTAASIPWLPFAASFATAAVAVLALLGWATGNDILTSVWHGATAMNPLTATCFILASSSLLLLQARHRSDTLARSLAIIVSIMGLMRILAVISGHDFHVDQALFPTEIRQQNIPNRMAPNTALAFLFVGSALCLISSKRLKLDLIAQILVFICIGIAISAILGTLYSASAFVRVGRFIPMAFNTACCFLLLGTGILSTTSETGVIRLLGSATMGGHMARRLTLAIILILPLLGWLCLRGEQSGSYDMTHGIALMVICSIGILLCVVFIGINAFYRLEEGAKEVQGRLNLAEEQLKTCIRGSNAGLWDWNIQAGGLYVAPKYLELLGYDVPSDSMEFVKFDAPREHVHEDDLRTIMDTLAGHKDAASLLDVNLRLRCADGSFRWFRSRGEITRDENGVPVRMAGATTDISELKEAEAEALQAQAQAQLANSAKSDFLSRMSHELRTPLNAVLGFAQLIQMDAKTDAELADVEQIIKAGKHLLILIDEVLDISRIEAGKLLVSVEPVPIKEVMDEVVQLMTPLAAKNDIGLVVSPGGLWAEYIFVDRQRLKQVLLNLASNAIKYNSANGVVTFSCESTDSGSIRILVVDTGGGIDESLTQKLFTPFERLGAENGSIEGTGLGLAFSKRLVELMSGTIGVESEVGNGSTFYVEFARSEHPAAAIRDELDDPTRSVTLSNPNQKTVLYIEDNKPNLELVETIFKRRSNVKLISAMQGRLGIDLAHQHKPDLILLDMNLPDIDGQKVLAELKADEQMKDIPVVIVSADAVSERIDLLLEEGAQAYLTKPISVADFLSVVDSVLIAA